jgi:hypothetical protein
MAKGSLAFAFKSSTSSLCICASAAVDSKPSEKAFHFNPIRILEFSLTMIAVALVADREVPILFISSQNLDVLALGRRLPPLILTGKVTRYDSLRSSIVHLI